MTDCAAAGFSGEGRCIEPAIVGPLCAEHAARGSAVLDWSADA